MAGDFIGLPKDAFFFLFFPREGVGHQSSWVGFFPAGKGLFSIQRKSAIRFADDDDDRNIHRAG